MGAAAVVSSGSAYVYGGTGGSGAGDVLWRLEPSGLRFERLTEPGQPGPGGRVHAALAIDAAG